MAAVTVIADKYGGAQISWAWNDATDPDGTGAGTRLLNTIAAGSFVTGHRYLLLYKVMVQGQAGIIDVEVRQGGVSIDKLQGTKAGNTTSYCMKQISGMTVLTGDDTKSLQIVGLNTTATSGNQFLNNGEMLLIDLDTSGAALTENTDWFHDENSTLHANPGSSYVSTQSPSVTFTPDGTSDYLVIGDIRFVGPGGNQSMRIYDTTDATELNVVGYGVSNRGTENSKHMTMWVLNAPAAVSKTITTEYLSDTSDKYNAEVFVLRLNAFASHSFAQTDYANAGNSGSYDPAGPASFTPDATGDVVLLGETKARTGVGATEASYGVLGRMRYDGAVTNQNIGYYITASANPATDVTGVGASFMNLLTGKSGTVDVDAEIYSNTTNATFVKQKKQLVVAFGTELAAVTTNLTPSLDIYFVITPPTTTSRNSVTSPTVDFEQSGVVKGDLLDIKTGPNAGSYVIRDVAANVLFLEQALPSEDQGPVEADIRKNRNKSAQRSAAIVVSQPTFNSGVGTYAVLDMVVV